MPLPPLLRGARLRSPAPLPRPPPVRPSKPTAAGSPKVHNIPKKQNNAVQRFLAKAPPKKMIIRQVEGRKEQGNKPMKAKPPRKQKKRRKKRSRSSGSARKSYSSNCTPHHQEPSEGKTTTHEISRTSLIKPNQTKSRILIAPERMTAPS